MFISEYHDICKMHDDILMKNVKFSYISKNKHTNSYLVAYPINFSHI